MKLVPLVSLLLIAAGAVVMAICIKRLIPETRKLKHVSKEAYAKIKGFASLHKALMALFLSGYVVVGVSLYLDIPIVGDLFVGVIFFFGAIFVLLGILLQSKMTASLKTQFDRAMDANADLEAERRRLSRLNDRLGVEIADRKQAESALTTSRAFLQTIIDSLPQQILVINRDYSIALANRMAAGLFGMSTVDGVMHCHQLSHGAETPCSGSDHPCPMAEILRTGKPVTMEHVHVDAEGNDMIVEIIAAPIVDEAGNIEQIVESCRDITLRRRSETQLEESEERYRMLSEVTMEGICFNEDSVIIDANDAFAGMFGYPRSELLGMDAVQHLIEPEYTSQIRHIVRSNSNEIYEVVGIRKDGTRFPAEIEGRSIQYRGRQVRVASVRDITERKRTEQRITMMQKMEAIGTLAGGIAHDFNNILSSIMGYTEICQLKTDPESAVASHLGSILKASHRARDLVAQILSFSRREEEAIRPVQIGPIIKESLKLLRPSIPATISIDARIDPDTGKINADPTQIHQVIMNLCTNAAHAMKLNGGKMDIRLSNHDVESTISNKMAVIEPGRYVRLMVSDTGKGIDAAVIERIFEPYFTTKEKGEGTGLGLFVVHGIVQRFDGWVDVKSQPDRGTTFTILFPRIEMEAQAADPDKADYPTGTETVMVIDDDENIVTMTCEMLANLGYRATPATGADEALELFEAVPDRFNLVITDQTMPGMTGEALVARMREINADIRVIICTGYSEMMNANRARACGINGFLMKPVKMADLARMARHVIDDGRSTPGS